MRARTRVRTVRAFGLALWLAAAGTAGTAAPAAEPFWSGPSAARAADGRWRLSLRAEGVADRVEHAPNAAGGGFEPARARPRYAAGALALDWHPSSDWRLRAGVGRRTLTSLRDSYRVDGLHLGVARRLPSPHPALGLELVLDADVHRAGELYKNSWTHVGEARLTGARLLGVRDDTLTLSLAARARPHPSTSVTLLLGGGTVRARHRALDGIGTDDAGCRYRLEAADGAGTLELVEPCGRTVAFREEYTSERGIERRLGFSPTADLAHAGRVLQTGVAVEHVVRRLSLSLAYVYRRRDRAGFDERIRERGMRTVASSHTTSLGIDFAATRSLGVGVGVHYRSTAYLDELPLLYNTFTSDRFVENVLSFSAGVTLSF